MPAKMITYRFFWRALLPNLVIITGTGFFPGGLFLNLVIITDLFFPPGEPFPSQEKKEA